MQTATSTIATRQRRPPSGWARWPAIGRLVWLVYLVLYPSAYLYARPTPVEILAGVLGVGVFLPLYLHSVFGPPRSQMPYVIAFALIGFALSPFGGIWSVFNVYAASAAGRLRPRRTLVITITVLQVSFLAFSLLTRQPWYFWVWGLFFGTMVGFGAGWQSEVEAKNQQLEAAQGEVRAMAESAERERIARDLHDLLGHTLTLVAVKADLAARLVARDADAARKEMEEVAQAARDALGEVRAAVSGMRGAAFGVELERARRMLLAAEVEAEIAGATSLNDPSREAVLAMALREAVTNVIRHAHAHSCSIRLEATPSAYRLYVEDDGRGGELCEGSGLTGMRARLAAAGGCLDIVSDGRGTRLTASLPSAA
jgi:two-component system sensor histidine kinase DesK